MFPRLVPILVFLTSLSLVGAELGEAERKFLTAHAPEVLKIIKEAEEEDHEDVLEEAAERVEGMREEFAEIKKEHGEEFANLVMQEIECEIRLEYLVWQLEEREIGEGAAFFRLRKIMEKRLEVEFAITREEIKHLRAGGEKEEADEVAAELKEREKNPRRELREMLREFEEEWEGGGEEEEEELPELEEALPEGEIYLPPPAGKVPKVDELAGVKFDFEQHVLPALETYCFDCHDAASAKGDIDLESALTEKPLVRNRALWENVAERIRNGDMPPKKKEQPSAEEKLQLRAWLAKEVDHFDYASVRNPGFLPGRRFTREEYNRTIRDLLGMDLRPADQFPMDFSGTSGFSNSANTLFLATAHLDRYLTSADLVVDQVRKNPEAWQQLLGKETPKAALARFAKRAYRRPLTAKERAQVEDRFAVAKKKGLSEDDALAEAFKFVLVTPHFLLRVEDGGNRSKNDQPVGAYDLATRLSYFLWASTPDDDLLTAAGSNRLSDAKGIGAQVERLMDDPKSRALGDIFAGEWLGTHNVGPRIRKDPIDNPWCTESLMKAMRDESALFVHSLIKDNAPVARLLDARYTFLNEELAKYYRIPGVKGEKMRRVELKSEERGGIFGHASVLAATSFPDRTSPVVRGTWILTTLLGTPPPPPPPNVPEIEGEGNSPRGVRTLRQRLQRHREAANCAGCHSQIDPLGFALENYGEFGQWRRGVDNHGTLPNGARFRGAAGLKLALIDTRLDDLGTQVIRKMLAYGLGRQLEFYDEATVLRIAAKLKPAGYPMRAMVKEIALSYPFTTKRPPQPGTATKEQP